MQEIGGARSTKSKMPNGTRQTGHAGPITRVQSRRPAALYLLFSCPALKTNYLDLTIVRPFNIQQFPFRAYV
jgi:hypothetical protein